MLLFKYLLLAVLVVMAGYEVWSGIKAAGDNLQRLRNWKRVTATVYAANDPTMVEVQLGEDRDAPHYKIPRTYDVGYEVASKVTVLENPARADDRRLTAFFDLWNPVLVAFIFVVALIVAGWYVWNSSWGQDVEWSIGQWRPRQAPLVAAAELAVYEPRESWVANLFYACVLGLPFALPAFFADGGWRPWLAVCATVGTAIFLLLCQSAVLNATRSVRYTSVGLEEVSLFGRRVVPAGELGGLAPRDSGEELERLKPWQDRRRIGFQHVRVWVLTDHEGREILTLPEKMTPLDTFEKLRRRVGVSTSKR